MSDEETKPKCHTCGKVLEPKEVRKIDPEDTVVYCEECVIKIAGKLWEPKLPGEE